MISLHGNHLRKRRQPSFLLMITLFLSAIMAGCQESEVRPTEMATPVILATSAADGTSKATVTATLSGAAVETVLPPLTATITAPARPTEGATATTVAQSTATGTAAGVTPPAVDMMLIGPFHLPPDEFRTPFTGAFRALEPDTAAEELEAAREAGMQLIIHLVGGRRRYQEVGGAFSTEKFNQQLEQFREFDLESYVADGTIVGHLLFDEPQDPSNWNGEPVPFADIEAVAAQSKELWPSLPVGVAGPPSFLKNGGPWANLDFAFAQYTTERGEINSWIAEEVQLATDSGLGLVFSINILGGNNRRSVNAQQLEEWGTLMASEPTACALLMWKYDPTYFSDPAVTQALNAIAEVARERSAVSCRS